jgi:FAD/FMN-containing dehydrogenase
MFIAPLATTDLVTSLRAQVRGDVVTADEPSFAAATFGVTGAEPELVLIAADATDVARAVRLATRAGRRIAVQTVGRRTVIAAEHTVLVVTRLLAGVRVDGDRRTATVGIGASWRQVLDAAEPFGLTPLSGASHLRPGRRSAGPAPRATVFAFAADRIRSFDIVTASGDRRQVGPANPEFFALRRGETAPGLVVAMTIDLVAHPALTVAEFRFAAADAARAIDGWQRWSAELPPTAITAVVPAAAGVAVRVAHIGDAAATDALLSSLRTATGVVAAAEFVGPATVAQVARGDVAGRLPQLAAAAA